MTQRLLVDTWFWLALKDRSDQDHALAMLTNEELVHRKITYVTTNFILAETYTLLRRRVRPQVAITFGQEIQKAIDLTVIELVHILPEMEREAWALFERYDDIVDLSYTDCTTFAAMRSMGLSEVLTNDQHFAMMGLILRP
ncbi:MAG: PIN domain-containing protein [Anaerolineae bacterium]|nr:PIN domain-containing protein [Anaerolineae bacterium]